MRHAHADFFDARPGTFLQNAIENDHERFGALEGKPFLADIALMQKRLERFRFQQRPQQV